MPTPAEVAVARAAKPRSGFNGTGLVAAAAVAAAALGCAAGAGAGSPVTRAAVPVRVTGCPAEDSCAIDYRRAPNGQPVWVIRRAAH